MTSMSDNNSAVVVIRESEAAFEEVGPGHWVGRAVTDLGNTVLGGGWAHFDDATRGLKWHLYYDEVLFVVAGQIDIEVDGLSQTATAGEAFVIRKDTIVTYRGAAGSVGFFVLYPREWADSVPGRSGRVE